MGANVEHPSCIIIKARLGTQTLRKPIDALPVRVYPSIIRFRVATLSKQGLVRSRAVKNKQQQKREAI